MRCVFVALFSVLSFLASGQNITGKLSSLFNNFLSDVSLKHATVSFYVINSNTGNVVFKKNEQTGLPAGSVQKVITSTTAYELLGSAFKYKTTFDFTGIVRDSVLDGNIHIKGSGDPTLGSSRYSATSENAIVSALGSALRSKGIKHINGAIKAGKSLWNDEGIPDHWIWQDLGNYFGARASAINWKENQFDVILRSGKKIGDSVVIIGTVPKVIPNFYLRSFVTSAETGSGDNTNIYLSLKNSQPEIRGTIPVNQNHFIVSGSLPDPAAQLESDLGFKLQMQTGSDNGTSRKKPVVLYTHVSPPLDSFNYWFLQKSINLYGEALLKTMGFEKTGTGSTDSGTAVIKNFWKQKGIDEASLRIFDGSGLSPENRITTHAIVTVMQYARKQKWFNSFYNSLPEINKTKMKSGTIGGTLAYSGYVTSNSGIPYTFAIVVHNYDGSAKLMREKMWKLIDILK